MVKLVVEEMYAHRRTRGPATVIVIAVLLFAEQVVPMMDSTTNPDHSNSSSSTGTTETRAITIALQLLLLHQHPITTTTTTTTTIIVETAMPIAVV
jgi:hypothetical protein